MHIQYDIIGKSGKLGREGLMIAYMDDAEIARKVGRKMGLMQVNREALIAGAYDGLAGINLAIIDEHDRGEKGNAADILFHPLANSQGIDHRLLSMWCWQMGSNGVVPLLEFAHPDYGKRAFRVDLIEARKGSGNYRGLESAVENLMAVQGVEPDVLNCCILNSRPIAVEQSRYNCEKAGAVVSASFMDYWDHGIVGDFDILLADFDIQGFSLEEG
ncbi:MAG: hypothetical protein ABIG95_02860 [Candidatus Woesearchaeota archaeon]